MWWLIKDDKAKIQRQILRILLTDASQNTISKCARRLNTYAKADKVIEAFHGLMVPCQGRCPSKCSQGIDESTGENCKNCNGWGYVEAKVTNTG